MIRKSKLLILLLFLIVLISSVSAIGAADSNATDVEAVDGEDVELEQSDSNVSDVQAVNDEDVELGRSDSGQDVLSDGNTFADLNELINSSESLEITLQHDYSRTSRSDADRINIYRDNLVIDGNGKTIKGVNGSDILGFRVYSKNVVIKNVSFYNLRSGYGYQGIAVGANSNDLNLTVINCIFRDCYGSSGGAVSNCALVEDCQFYRCWANYYAGAAYNSDLKGCYFMSCYAYSGGGAVYDCTVSDCVFENNQARNNGVNGDTSGGAMYKGTAINCTFKGNTATRDGGAMYNGNAINCTFEGNSAQRFAGALSTGTVVNCNFTKNHAGQRGGATFNSHVMNSTFINNSAGYGGACYLDSSISGVSTYSFVNCTFIDNTANGPDSTNNGGGIYAYGSNGAKVGTAILCHFEHNGGKQCGGAYGTSLVLCTFKDNYVSNNNYNYQKDYGNCNFPDLLMETTPVSVNYPYPASLPLDLKYYTQHLSSKYYPDYYYHFKDIGINFTLYENGPVGSYQGLSDSSYELNLEPGTYLVVFALSNQSSYNNKIGSSYTATTIFVKGYKTIINSSDIEMKIGNTANITATLIDDYSGKPIADVNLTVTIYGNPSTLKTDKNGQISIQVPELPADSYLVSINFTGGGLYEASSKNINVLIEKIDTRLLADNVTAFYNEGIITAKLTDEYGNPLPGSDLIVTVSYLAGESKKTNKSGEIEYSLVGKGLAEGKHTAKIEFRENGTHKGSNISINVNLYRLKSNITAENISFVYGESGILSAYLKDSNGDPISYYEIHLRMDSLYELRMTDSEGHVDFDLSNYLLMPGNSEGRIYFETTNRYIGTSIPVNVTVYKVSTEISAPDVTCMYGEGKYLVVTLKDKYGNPVANESVSIKSTIKTLSGKTDDNGQARFLIDLPPKSYSVALSFSGNAILDATSSNAKVVVTQISEKISTVISAYNLVSVYNEGKYLTITLMDDYGDVMPGRPLSINFNGKTKTYKTDAKGQVKLSTASLVPKKYQAKITFSGDNRYKGSSFKVNLVVKKANPYLFVSKKKFNVKTSVKKYKVTLKTNKNLAMKNVKVYLKVKGKTYTVKTNKNGQAIFKLKGLSKKGTYKAVATYKGNSCYNKVSKNAKITVR